jgi:hypothetical protein
LTIQARRSSVVTQIRCSLDAIDSQLEHLTAAHKEFPADKSE